MVAHSISNPPEDYEEYDEAEEATADDAPAPAPFARREAPSKHRVWLSDLFPRSTKGAPASGPSRTAGEKKPARGSKLRLRAASPPEQAVDETSAAKMNERIQSVVVRSHLPQRPGFQSSAPSEDPPAPPPAALHSPSPAEPAQPASQPTFRASEPPAQTEQAAPVSAPTARSAAPAESVQPASPPTFRFFAPPAREEPAPQPAPVVEFKLPEKPDHERVKPIPATYKTPVWSVPQPAPEPAQPEPVTQEQVIPEAKESPMSRVEELNRILRKLQNESAGVEASALISEDGLMIASALGANLEETRVAGMTATLLNLGNRAAVELKRGEVNEVVVRGAHGYAVMIGAGRGALLLVLANESSKLGLIFFDMHDAVLSLKKAL